jgi:predicted transcriptional regulator YdeE
MKVVEREAFWVMGIHARTSNEREMRPGGVIPEIWNRFMKEGLPEMVPTRIGNALIALYTDYESNEHGEYTFAVGARVHEGAEPGGGLSLWRVPAGRYWNLATERGPVWQVVPAAWKRVWAESGDRTFQTDFEIYDERATDPSDAVVELYVGVR